MRGRGTGQHPTVAMGIDLTGRENVFHRALHRVQCWGYRTVRSSTLASPMPRWLHDCAKCRANGLS